MQAMTLIPKYEWLKKRNPKGKMQLFEPLRAVGLAIEKGHKASLDKGLSNVEVSDVDTVKITGKLEGWDGASWQDLKTCFLSLRPQDSALALEAIQKQREYFQDLGYNYHKVDFRLPGSRVSLDLLGDFSPLAAPSLQACGKVWVELKAFDSDRFDKKEGEEETKLKQLLPRVMQADSNIQGVRLVCSRMEKAGHGHYKFAGIQSKLLAAGAENFVRVEGTKQFVSRGFAASKPDLVTTFSKLEWHTPVSQAHSGTKVALLADLLKVLKQPPGTPGKRAQAFNKRLKGPASRRLRTLKLAKAGQKPWVGTKAVMRKVYKML